MPNMYNEPPSNVDEKDFKDNLTSDPTGNKLGSWAWLHTPAASFSEKSYREKISLIRRSQSIRKPKIAQISNSLDQANDNLVLQSRGITSIVLKDKTAMALMVVAVFVGGIVMAAAVHQSDLWTAAQPFATGADNSVAGITKEVLDMDDTERLELMFEDPDKMADMLNNISVGN